MDRPPPLGSAYSSSSRSGQRRTPSFPSPSTPPSSQPLGLAGRPSLTAGLPLSALDPNIRNILNAGEGGGGGQSNNTDDIRASLGRDHHPSIQTIGDIPTHPRSNWNVQDTSLRPVPAFYPPLDRNCAVFISDSSPSVVAVRISECLRKRSVSVEYDDEAATASGITADRVRFAIYLYRGSRSIDGGKLASGADSTGPTGTVSTSSSSDQQQQSPDFSYGVIVEVQRIRGDTQSFHRTCKAVLRSAIGDSDGLDDFRTKSGKIGQSPFGFGRAEQEQGQQLGGERRNVLLTPLPCKARQPRIGNTDLKSSSPSPTALLALERVLDLLRKDRLGAQLLGMESLAILTDICSSGVETAMVSSLTVLGAPVSSVDDDDEEPLLEIHSWVLSLLKDRSIPGGEIGPDGGDMSTDDGGGSGGRAGATVLSGSSSPFQQSSGYGRTPQEEDAMHVSALRGLALRTFTNSLSVVSQERKHLLRSILQTHCEHLVSSAFLSAFMEDLAGASRPPSAVTWESGTRFGSAHDAALSAKCIRLLVECSDDARDSVVKLASFGSGGYKPLLAALEKAKLVGRSSHAVLEREAELSHAALSTGFRDL